MAVDAARAKSLFLAASDLSEPAERAGFLDRECGGDAELRRRVDALLRAHSAVPSAPAEMGDAASGQIPDDLPPTNDYLDPTASVGSIVAGKYKLIQEIGEGGMGSVYMAQQTEPVRRAVAVKIIKPGMDSKAVLARFEAERQALAMMDHPNIAKVLDAGTTDGGRPFFVMELVKGVPITQYCDERKLTPRQRLELFVPVCQAIQHAHLKGIIHRDIKPSNVLVALYDDHAVPKVIDFGVAKAAGQALTDKTLMTGFGAVVGTPEYMSPEQASLNNMDIDTRSDVYSLGVLLYELLTGSTPVDRKSLGKAALLEILRIVREVEAPRPSFKLSTIDTLPSVAANRGTEPARLSKLLKGELDWVVLKALEKDRSRRYESASDLARDIERYLADEVVEARPPSTAYRMKKFVRRHQGQVVAAVAVAVAFLSITAAAVVGGFYAEARHARKTAEHLKESAVNAEANAQKEKRIAQKAAAESKRSKERVRQVSYAADVQLAQNHWEANRPLQMLDLLQQHIPAPGDEDLRGFEWHYLWRLANSAQRTLRGHAQPIARLAFAGSNGTLLSGDVEYQYRTAGTLRKWPGGRTENATTLFTQRESPSRAGYFPGIRALAVSPEGTHYAVVDDGAVRMLNVETGQPARVLAAFSAEPQAVAFAPELRHLAVGDRGGEITIWDLDSGEKKRTFGKHRLPVRCLQYSPDGRRLVTGSGDGSAPTWSQLLNGELWLWNADDGQRVAQCGGVRSFVNDLSINTQGTSVAAATMEGTVVLWDMNGPEGVRILRGHSGSVSSVRWLPDGRYLASAGDDGTVQVWDIGREGAKRIYRGHSGPVTALAVSPDGSLLASGGRDANIQLWNPKVDPRRTIITDLPYAIGTVAFSGDGQRLAVGTYSQVTVCDTRQFEKLHVLPIDHWTFDVAVSHDGGRVATAGNQGSSGEEPGIVKVWDVASGAARGVFDPQVLSARHVAFSPDGRLLACSGRAAERDQGQFTVTLWNIEQKTQLQSRTEAVSFDFSPDGTSLALAGRGGVWLWRWDGKAVSERRLSDRACREIRFSPDGRRLAVIDAKGQVWLRQVTDSPDQLLGLATHGLEFSPDGRWIAAFSESSTCVWNVAEGQVITTIPYTTDHLRFTPDGRTLVTAGREVRLWQTETGRELINLGAYATGGVSTIALSPDGTKLSVGGGYRDEHEGVWVWQSPRTHVHTREARRHSLMP